MNIASVSAHNLWHLFVADETYKMRTFLRSGLWCAELNSIVSFDADVEGSQPFGIFVSCWHRSKGDPTSSAWQIFGASGNGFALRAKPSIIQSVAERFNSGTLRVRYDEVRYLRSGEKPTDAAFEVAPSHSREEEMRLAVSFVGLTDSDDCKGKEQIRRWLPRLSDHRTVTRFQDVSFAEDEGQEAIILPVSPEDLIEEIVIGPRVSTEERKAFVKMLEGSPVASIIRT